MPKLITARPSGHEEADEAADTQKEKDNDCAINQTEPRLFGVVGRNERRIENIALPADVVCNPGHTIRSSIRWATGDRRDGERKVDAAGHGGTGFCPGR